jgi:hypothetical protein
LEWLEVPVRPPKFERSMGSRSCLLFNYLSASVSSNENVPQTLDRAYEIVSWLGLGTRSTDLRQTLLRISSLSYRHLKMNIQQSKSSSSFVLPYIVENMSHHLSSSGSLYLRRSSLMRLMLISSLPLPASSREHSFGVTWFLKQRAQRCFSSCIRTICSLKEVSFGNSTTLARPRLKVRKAPNVATSTRTQLSLMASSFLGI